MRATFVQMHWENDDQTIVSFSFMPKGRYRYEAGQYAVISLPHDDPDDRGIERTMTLSSSPDDDLLRMTMRIYGEGSSFKKALLALRPGDQVTIFDALGDFVLPLDTSIPLVFVGGGVGIASYVGMLRWLTAHQERRPITLLYAVRCSGDIVLQEIFDSYSSQFPITKILYLSDGRQRTACAGKVIRQRLGADDILEHLKSDGLVYLSGPEIMVENLISGLKLAGIHNQQIVFDYFDGYSEI